ncbi:MAG TPA: LysR family transcriptional regulator [Caulobacteraceae bacterium]|nr:LysR family transcriptional regulator [Caulobacteraceae bacterium]
MDRLHAMELYVRVVETGSFSAAARDLRMGQPSVSKTVAALEARLGVRLLVRSSRQLHPTEAGEAFYERARRALAEADEAESAARGLGAGLAGRLRVCAPVTFGRLHIAPRLGEFLDAHPALRLELVMDDRRIDLMEENIDVALRLGDLSDSSLTARKLASTDRLVVASPAYLERKNAPRTPSELMAHEAVVYSQQAVGDEWRLRQGSTEISVRAPSRIAFSAAEGFREGLLAGLGLGIAPRWMVSPELAAGTLVPVLTDWTLPGTDLWAIYPTGRMPTAKARAFIAWVEDVMAR